MQQRLHQQEETTSQLKEEVNRLEQYSRRSHLRIRGLKLEHDQNCKEAVSSFICQNLKKKDGTSIKETWMTANQDNSSVQIEESTENLQNFNNLNGECKISDDINIDLQKCTESFKKFPIVENIYRTPVNTTEQLSSFIKESTENLQNFNNLNGECKISDDINIDLQKMGIEDVGNTPRHNSVGMKEHELCDFKQGEFLHVKNVRATEKRFGLSIVWCTMNDANDLL
ncbi:hypothetical protein CAPTEDRAFT_209350 [Capitella teleta]|uniref:Uncharacterized protein n=1 Tax=Capitella teleta TaxID=283909 RepID=R7V4L3_CAPTE|nr:hypothetical protein CAPTEDRAFT_209350 [Capitella teleta]|eukprot:ELU13783.1 hypothetical protein CAPTEDRAFT_209350 [Capitella teleta]